MTIQIILAVLCAAALFSSGYAIAYKSNRVRHVPALLLPQELHPTKLDAITFNFRRDIEAGKPLILHSGATLDSYEHVG